jgi:hypothetical protein
MNRLILKWMAVAGVLRRRPPVTPRSRAPKVSRPQPMSTLPLKPEATLPACRLQRGALHGEVQFNTERVISVDGVTHPGLRHADSPAKIDVV